jgi:hypothetical protein
MKNEEKYDPGEMVMGTNPGSPKYYINFLSNYDFSFIIFAVSIKSSNLGFRHFLRLYRPASFSEKKYLRYNKKWSR